MKVTLVAWTRLDGNIWDLRLLEGNEGNGHPDLLAEFAGRSCYQSWDNPSGRDNRSYLANIIEQQHFSVLEHASATFYIEGVSRSLTHELIRHRHLSFSQLSQRFVDESARNNEYVIPPAYAGDEDAQGILESAVDSGLDAYEALVRIGQDRGLTRKQAREAARAVLPNATETKIVVTGNHRAWREFLHKRRTPHADVEIQLLAQEILRQLKELAPATYQDFTEE